MDGDIVVPNFDCIDLTELNLPIITIYKNPSDYKGQYVARIFDSEMPTNTILVCNTLKELRELIPNCFIKMHRNLTDPKIIVETYI